MNIDPRSSVNIPQAGAVLINKDNPTAPAGSESIQGLDLARQNLSKLDSSIQTLEGVLQQVLSPQGPPSEDTPPQEYATELGTQIQAVAIALNTLNTRIQDLTKRVNI